MDVNATRLLCTLFFLYSPYHSPSPPPPPPAPAPRRVSDSYHYGACPAAPRVQHAATCPAGFDATCHAASPSPLPSPVSLSLPLSHSRCHSSCLFFMSSATNRTRFPHEWAKTSRARLPVCLPVLASLIHSPPSILMLLFLLCLPHWLMRKYAFHRSVVSVCCPRFELLLNISPSFCLKSAQYLSISIRTTLKRNTDLALSKMGTRFLIVSSLIEAFNN